MEERYSFRISANRPVNSAIWQYEQRCTCLCDLFISFPIHANTNFNEELPPGPAKCVHSWRTNSGTRMPDTMAHLVYVEGLRQDGRMWSDVDASLYSFKSPASCIPTIYESLKPKQTVLCCMTSSLLTWHCLRFPWTMFEQHSRRYACLQCLYNGYSKMKMPLLHNCVAVAPMGSALPNSRHWAP